MNQEPKKEKKTRRKARIHDLKPEKDAKGGEGSTFTYSKPAVEYKQQ